MKFRYLASFSVAFGDRITRHNFMLEGGWNPEPVKEMARKICEKENPGWTDYRFDSLEVHRDHVAKRILWMEVLNIEDEKSED